MIKNVNPDGTPKYTNRLIHESSPYLRDHAHNSIDWFPWGEEALAKARAEDKPILISVGYAACHWCHVMAHESFEDESVAAVQNERFVNIKVDREERPDLDSIYMSAVQALTGSGGWPLNVFLMPDGTPFYGGTYFPPDEKAARYRMPSWRQVLLAVSDAYQNRRDEVAATGKELLAAIGQVAAPAAEGGAIAPALLDDALAQLAQGFDERNGGFGSAPKFPQPMILEFLLRSWARSGDERARGMLDLTLTKMAHGGMYDQLGGGFHRYSVDDHWLVPHFEKMLYDNALLARIYAEAYQGLRTPLYRRIVEETLDYVLREMTHPDGGFFASQDADSLPAPDAGHAEEGAFFVWSLQEVREALGADAMPFAALYDLTDKGNFEGKNILQVKRSPAEVARVVGQSVEQVEALAARGRQKLFALREGRPKPFRDEKIIAAWNGMMLRAFAAASQALGRDDYLQVARRNAAFVLEALRPNGRLLRSWTGGKLGAPAFLEDYALLADGLLSLYSADGDTRWLRESIALTDDALALFWDDALGGFYDTAADAERLVTRPRDISDNATPSGNSAIVDVLLRLHALTGVERYRERAEAVLQSLAGALARFPSGFGRLLCAADFALAQPQEVAIVGDAAREDTRALIEVLRERYRPYAVVALLHPADSEAPQLTPLLEGRAMIDGMATAYVCRNFACRLPVAEPGALREQLDQN
jgi:uncharacterized protein YyaL (SSP411 family)